MTGAPTGYIEITSKDDVDSKIKDKDERSVAKHYLKKGCKVYWNKHEENKENENRADFVIICEMEDEKCPKCVAIIEVKGGDVKAAKVQKQIQGTVDQLVKDNLLPDNPDCVHVEVFAPKGVGEEKEEFEKDSRKVTVKKKKKEIEHPKQLEELPCCPKKPKK